MLISTRREWRLTPVLLSPGQAGKAAIGISRVKFEEKGPFAGVSATGEARNQGGSRNYRNCDCFWDQNLDGICAVRDRP